MDGREVQEGGMYVYLWLIHIVVWQKPTQHCKAIILQLKILKRFLQKVKKNNIARQYTYWGTLNRH